MKFDIETLRDHRLARFFARLSNHCTVVLSSGIEIHFNRSSHSAVFDTSEPLSSGEDREYIQAMELIDV